VFIILKQRIDSIKVERNVSIHNEENVIEMESDGVCVPQECEPELSDILSWFLWWWLLVYNVVCGFVHMELLRLVGLQLC
jgi:hypothetical protein